MNERTAMYNMDYKINVLFASRMDFGLRTGGVQMQLTQTRQALESMGVNVIQCNPWQDSLKDADVCHLFTTAPEMFSYAKTATQRKIPLVITPVMNSPEPVWQMKIKTKLLSQLPGMYSQLRQARAMLAAADAVLPLTEDEKAFLTQVFEIPTCKMQVIPNGVENRFSLATHELFVQKFGFKPDVLFVGRIDRNKNILSLITALAGTGLKLAVVGFPYAEEQNVFEQFKTLLGVNVTYVGHLHNSDPLLASAYAASKVFCLPSFKEVMPLTVLEALAAGCRIVMTTNSAMTGFLGHTVNYVNPRNPADIRKKVLAACQSEPPCLLRQRVLETCSWEKVGIAVYNVYAKLLTNVVPGKY
jgi:glycosyltransferase involved in cell wall biosynthesis